MRKILIAGHGITTLVIASALARMSSEDVLVVDPWALNEKAIGREMFPDKIPEMKSRMKELESQLPMAPAPLKYFDESKNFINGKTLPRRNKRK